MDLQILSNFSVLVDQYRRAKATGADKLQALDEETCTLSIKVYSEQTGNAEWRFLGNIPLTAIDEIIAEKEKEIAEIKELKSSMIELLKVQK